MVDQGLNSRPPLANTLTRWRVNSSIQKTVGEIVNVTDCEEFRKGKVMWMRVLKDDVNKNAIY